MIISVLGVGNQNTIVTKAGRRTESVMVRLRLERHCVHLRYLNVRASDNAIDGSIEETDDRACVPTMLVANERVSSHSSAINSIRPQFARNHHNDKHAQFL